MVRVKLDPHCMHSFTLGAIMLGRFTLGHIAEVSKLEQCSLSIPQRVATSDVGKLVCCEITFSRCDWGNDAGSLVKLAAHVLTDL